MKTLSLIWVSNDYVKLSQITAEFLSQSNQCQLCQLAYDISNQSRILHFKCLSNVPIYPLLLANFQLFLKIFCQITFIISHSNNLNGISTRVYIYCLKCLSQTYLRRRIKSCSKFRENFYPNWKTCFGRVFFSKYIPNNLDIWREETTLPDYSNDAFYANGPQLLYSVFFGGF